MKAYLSRRFRFSASHRLHAESLSAEENRAIFGKCNNPFGHGHNYTVEVCFSGTVDPVTGMVTNLADLDEFAHREILLRFDHSNLNTLEEFATRVPSTENLALEIHRVFTHYPHAKLERVHVEETGNNAFTYPATTGVTSRGTIA